MGSERTRLHRLKSGQHAEVYAEAAVARGLSGGGQALDTGTRAAIEPRFGHDFSQVRIHTDARAAASADAVNAHAYTIGRDIAFGPGEYAPGTSAGQRLLTHELTHVVQQKGTPTHRIQRAVKTNGGEFDTTNYAAVTAGAAVGCDIDLKFTPNDLVESEKIALTQTSTRLSSPGGGTGAPTDAEPGFTASDAVLKARATTAAEGDPGRIIDRVDFAPGSTLPTTNPMYGVHNTPADPGTGAAAKVSSSLGDTAPGGNAAFGAHRRKSDGTFETPVDATLHDGPRTSITSPGQEWLDKFETTALVIDGPMAGTYLGSVAWGWKSDASGTSTLQPDPIKMVRPGAPTSEFMAAATRWNNQTITDPSTGTTHNTVDLPITTLDTGTVAAHDMSTPDLVTRILQVNTQLGSLAAGPDKTNKDFEKKALEDEFLKRSIKVTVKVHETEDWIGSDNVYVSIAGFGKAHRTGEKKLNNGETGDFLVPLSAVMAAAVPGFPFVIHVYDADWPDADDLMFDKVWLPPYSPVTDIQSRDDGRYEATIQFDK